MFQATAHTLPLFDIRIQHPFKRKLLSFQLSDTGCQTADVGASLWRDAQGVMTDSVQVYVNVTDSASGKAMIPHGVGTFPKHLPIILCKQ